MEHVSQVDHPPSQMFTPVSLNSDHIDNVSCESSSSPQYHNSIQQYILNEEEAYLDNSRVSNYEGEGLDDLSDEGDYYEDNDLSDEGGGLEREQHLELDNVVDNVQPIETTSSFVTFYDQLEEYVESSD